MPVLKVKQVNIRFTFSLSEKLENLEDQALFEFAPIPLDRC